ncbi:winged helix-turn-helix domain-containing protein [Vibrio caribbeanicus]|uniref:winged helix-turn-helix domain-containing protein n=1 Tax=Vibrio caribbeanicus TaxID=701175 RepID=UPI0022842477|nr:winged helix-turn-helix domain-containing protein [Vibrio caribbeanicus]MCY9845605.1 winged helix-turn-helix domain-containing protein [Vibrio caribbeanicus]
MPISNSSTLHCDDIVLDTKEMTVTCQNNNLKLNYNEFLIFKHFLFAANSVVSKETLMATGWPNSVVTESSLHKAIFNLRSSLSQSKTVRIKTIPSKGYMLMCEYSGLSANSRAEKDSISEPSIPSMPKTSEYKKALAEVPTSKKIFRLGIVFFSVVLLAASINSITGILIYKKPIVDQKIELKKVNDLRVLKYKNQEVPQELLNSLSERKNTTIFFSHYAQTNHIAIFNTKTNDTENYYVSDAELNDFIDKLSILK